MSRFVYPGTQKKEAMVLKKRLLYKRSSPRTPPKNREVSRTPSRIERLTSDTVHICRPL